MDNILQQIARLSGAVDSAGLALSQKLAGDGLVMMVLAAALTFEVVWLGISSLLSSDDLPEMIGKAAQAVAIAGISGMLITNYSSVSGAFIGAGAEVAGKFSGGRSLAEVAKDSAGAAYFQINAASIYRSQQAIKNAQAAQGGAQ